MFTLQTLLCFFSLLFTYTCIIFLFYITFFILLYVDNYILIVLYYIFILIFEISLPYCNSVIQYSFFFNICFFIFNLYNKKFINKEQKRIYHHKKTMIGSHSSPHHFRTGSNLFPHGQSGKKKRWKRFKWYWGWFVEGVNRSCCGGVFQPASPHTAKMFLSALVFVLLQDSVLQKVLSDNYIMIFRGDNNIKNKYNNPGFRNMLLQILPSWTKNLYNTG